MIALVLSLVKQNLALWPIFAHVLIIDRFFFVESHFRMHPLPGATLTGKTNEDILILP